MHGRKPKPAVPNSHRGYPMPARNRAVGIPVQLRVVVRVQVDKPRGDYEARGIEHPRGAAAWQAANFGNLAVCDPDVGTIPWHPRAIDNRPSPDQRIEFRHKSPPWRTS